MLSDTQFLQQFETLALEPSEFTHLDHIRIAWLYLNTYPLETAIRKTTHGISRYAQSLGAAEKFHFTLTHATIVIIAMRLNQDKAADFNTFIANNIDLVNRLPELLAEHYSTDLLNSLAAKQHFIEPDLIPLPDVSHF